MDIYFTIEEKYLQAIDELNYGDSPKALQLLNEILAKEPNYARAHYQLGLLNYYNIEDYQAAGYHFRLCTEFEPNYPDVYYHYLKLIIFLNITKMVAPVAEKALKTPGVNTAAINNLLALHQEKQRNWKKAPDFYRRAMLESTSKKENDEMQESISRVKSKKNQLKKHDYEISV